jgi:hypothetical protein
MAHLNAKHSTPLQHQMVQVTHLEIQPQLEQAGAMNGANGRGLTSGQLSLHRCSCGES